MAEHEVFARFYNRSRGPRPRGNDLATSRVETLMAAGPITCTPDTSAQDAARTMRDNRVSSLCVTVPKTELVGIVTTRDLSGKVLAEGLPLDTPGAAGDDRRRRSRLSPAAIGSDVLHLMMERRIGHIPIVEAGKLVGIVSQSDLTRFQAVSSAELVSRDLRRRDAPTRSPTSPPGSRNCWCSSSPAATGTRSSPG